MDYIYYIYMRVHVQDVTQCHVRSRQNGIKIAIGYLSGLCAFTVVMTRNAFLRRLNFMGLI